MLVHLWLEGVSEDVAWAVVGSVEWRCPGGCGGVGGGVV